VEEDREMLISETVIIRWHSRYKEYYESKGYIFTKFKDEFEIKTIDLQNGSVVEVIVKCDHKECKTPISKPVRWQDYLKCAKEDGKYYCHTCAMVLYGDNNYRISRLNNGKSFYQWCYDNLPKEQADSILSKWDYSLNLDKNGNVLTPKLVGYGSRGINKKGYWFKCLDHPEHLSELNNINSFTSGRIINIDCKICNSILMMHPDLETYLVNKGDAINYDLISSSKILAKCPDCGYVKEIIINNLINNGFGCNKCSDNISYPEKFLFNMLEQLNVDFQIQLSKKTFKWCKNYRYDFYIKNINCIIETHGLQHYKQVTGTWGKLSNIQENDKIKKQLAKDNGVSNYIILDCTYSKIEWIKNNITLSQLIKLLNFKESDVDWALCHEYACSSLVKITCELWDSGINNVLELANILKLSKSAIWTYLNQGVELGWCTYDGKEERKRNVTSLAEKNCKQVICVTTGEIFNSQKEATKAYMMKGHGGICQCCTNKKKSAGKHPITGEKLKWMYYDEYMRLKEAL